jgi:hypothetical protein
MYTTQVYDLPCWFVSRHSLTRIWDTAPREPGYGGAVPVRLDDWTSGAWPHATHVWLPGSHATTAQALAEPAGGGNITTKKIILGSI